MICRGLPFVLLLFLSACTEGQRLHKAERRDKKATLLQQLLRHYNNAARPYDGGQPVNISIDIFIKDIRFYDSTNTVTLDMYLRQRWVDPRLVYDEEEIGVSSVLLRAGMWDILWVPDTFFQNTLSVNRVGLHRFMRLAPNGGLLYSQSIQMAFPVVTDFKNFPFDTSFINIQVESYSHSEENMILQFQAISRAKDLSAVDTPVGSMEIGDIFHNSTTEQLATGSYQRLTGTIQLTRTVGRFFLGYVFLPTFLLVVLSFVGFWLRTDVISGRLFLGLFITLIMIVIKISMQPHVPKTITVTGLDLWFNACVLFVLFTLLELALVVFLGYFGRPSKPDEEKNTSANSDSLMARVLAGLDVVSGVLFPVAFIIFNIIYWTSF